MAVEKIETVIVGGGQAGLATSYWLKQHGREHIVLEKAGRPGHAWRQRWDSFTLVTPNWMFRLPGAEYGGADPGGFMPRDEIVATFERYVAGNALPVSFGVDVTAVERLAGRPGYLVRTQETEFEAQNVVMATGLFQHAKIPAFAAGLPSDVQQLPSEAIPQPCRPAARRRARRRQRPVRLPDRRGAAQERPAGVSEHRHVRPRAKTVSR